MYLTKLTETKNKQIEVLKSEREILTQCEHAILCKYHMKFVQCPFLNRTSFGQLFTIVIDISII
jgi:hypothetical protein